MSGRGAAEVGERAPLIPEETAEAGGKHPQTGGLRRVAQGVALAVVLVTLAIGVWVANSPQEQVHTDKKWLAGPPKGTYLIANVHSGRRLYAQKFVDGEDWTKGVGAGPSTQPVYDDNKWVFEPQQGGSTYLIVNADSGRRLYAQKFLDGEDWTKGVGAGPPQEQVYDDNHWVLDAQLGGLVIKNAASGRRLYAQKLVDGEDWTKGVGAGPPHQQVYADNKWILLAV